MAVSAVLSSLSRASLADPLGHARLGRSLGRPGWPDRAISYSPEARDQDRRAGREVDAMGARMPLTQPPTSLNAPVYSALATYARTVRGFGRDLRLLLASQVLFWIAIGFWGVLANLYLLRLGYDPKGVGLVNAATMLGMAAGALPSGELGRRMTLRRAMILGNLVWALAQAAYAGALLLPGSCRSAWLIGASVVYGVSYTCVAVNFSPLLMACLTGEQSDHAFSANIAMNNAAAFLAALLAGLLPGLFAGLLGAAPSDPRPYALGLLVPLVAVVPSVLALARTQQPETAAAVRAEVSGAPLSAPLPREGPPLRLILPVSLVLLTYWLGAGSVQVFWTVYLDSALHVATPVIGTISAVSQVASVPASLMAPLVIARFGRRVTYPLGLLGAAASMLLLGLAPGALLASLAVIGRQALSSISWPTINSVSQSVVTTRWRGMMSGATSTATYVGWGITALAGGYLIAASGYRLLFLGGAVLVTLAAAIYWVWYGEVGLR